MENNTVLINNKEYQLPESALYIFNEYLDKYYRNQKLKDLENLKNNLMDQYTKTPALKFRQKKQLKKQIENITLDLMRIGINKEKIQIPDWQTINDYSLKYQFLLKLTNLVSNVTSEFAQEYSKEVLDVYRKFVFIINQKIDFAKMSEKKGNYNHALKNLYKVLEINLTINNLMRDLDNNPNLNIDEYISGLIHNKSESETNETNLEPNISKSL